MKSKLIRIPYSLERTQIVLKLLELLNQVQPNPEKRTTETENKLIAEFLLLPESKFKHQRFSLLAKKRVVQALKEKYGWAVSRENMNNKIYTLIEKGIITRDEDNILYIASPIVRSYSTLVEALDSKQEFNFVFSFKEQTIDEKDDTTDT